MSSEIRNRILESLGMINESVYDKLKFKAVFMAGGPGSGKSFVIEKAFPDAALGTDEGGNEMYQGGGKWKVVNSDHMFVRGLVQAYLPLKVAQKDDPVTFGMQQNVRNVGKGLQKLRNLNWLNGMLPVILDGTCKHAGSTLKVKQMLEELGYDTYMIFVDTDVETAVQRNATRTRSVPEDLVRKVNAEVKANKDTFAQAFGENFFYANNSQDWRAKDAAGKAVKKAGTDITGKPTSEVQLAPEGQAFVAGLQKFGRKVENPKIMNPKGQEIVKTLEAKGGAYLADYYAPGEQQGKSGSSSDTISSKIGHDVKTPQGSKKGVDL